MSIIDNVLNTVAKEVGKVQEKSQEMMQGFSLNNQIKELERKKNARLIEIGRAIYEKQEKQREVTDEMVSDWVAEVVAIDHEMAVLQSELDQVRVRNDPDATPTAKGEAKAGYSASPNFFCSACGAPANRDKSFCPGCGASLSTGGGKNGGAKSGGNGTDEVEVEVEKL